MPKSEQSLASYRLNNELFYFKLCPARIENYKSDRMVNGMYIPLELWDILLKDRCTDGPKGGKQLNYELKINYAKGYRVYFKEKDGKIILLLIGGDKSTQQKDIEKAKEIWRKIKK